ncbi:MAG TPA: glycosyltransferase family 39 protein [Rhodanobacteraceae bacterium]|nr:glycosyltransferase family 39 protein [Rhodanobacteraceae bacterium]
MTTPVPLNRSRALWLRDARHELIWFGVFALLLLGLGMGLRDPWPSDEPRFALVAQWMVQHGQWLFPHRGQELYSDKPPVFFWLEAASYLITRSWRVAFLLPSLLSGLLTLGLVYDLARRLWSHRAGLLAALALLVTIQFTFQFRKAQIDPVLVGFMTLANYGLLRHLLLGPSRRWFATGCLFAGIGVVTKGVGVLSLLMFVPFAFAARRHWRPLPARGTHRWRWLLAGFGLFLLPILAWLVPMLLAAHFDGDPSHAAYVRDILFGQTVHRYAAFSGHQHPAWYFLQVIAFNWLPLSLLLPWALPAWWHRLRRRDARFLLPLGWAVLTVLFFSLSSGKRGVYILPALPMVALALAPLLPGLLRKRGPRVLVLGLTALLSILLTVASAWAVLDHPHWAENLRGHLDPRLWHMFLAIGAAGVLVVLATRLRRAAAGWVLFAGVLWALYGLWGYPLLNGDRSARDVMHAARVAAGPDTTIGLVAWKEQNLLMAEGPVTEFGFSQPDDKQFAAAIAWLRKDPTHRRIFIRKSAMDRCVRRDRATELGHANEYDWWLVGADALVPGCAPQHGSNTDGG